MTTHIPATNPILQCKPSSNHPHSDEEAGSELSISSNSVIAGSYQDEGAISSSSNSARHFVPQAERRSVAVNTVNHGPVESDVIHHDSHRARTEGSGSRNTSSQRNRSCISPIRYVVDHTSSNRHSSTHSSGAGRFHSRPMIGLDSHSSSSSSTTAEFGGISTSDSVLTNDSATAVGNRSHSRNVDVSVAQEPNPRSAFMSYLRGRRDVPFEGYASRLSSSRLTPLPSATEHSYALVHSVNAQALSDAHVLAREHSYSLASIGALEAPPADDVTIPVLRRSTRLATRPHPYNTLGSSESRTRYRRLFRGNTSQLSRTRFHPSHSDLHDLESDARISAFSSVGLGGHISNEGSSSQSSETHSITFPPVRSSVRGNIALQEEPTEFNYDTQHQSVEQNLHLPSLPFSLDRSLFDHNTDGNSVGFDQADRVYNTLSTSEASSGSVTQAIGELHDHLYLQIPGQVSTDPTSLPPILPLLNQTPIMSHTEILASSDNNNSLQTSNPRHLAEAVEDHQHRSENFQHMSETMSHNRHLYRGNTRMHSISREERANRSRSSATSSSPPLSIFRRSARLMNSRPMSLADSESTGVVRSAAPYRPSTSTSSSRRRFREAPPSARPESPPFLTSPSPTSYPPTSFSRLSSVSVDDSLENFNSAYSRRAAEHTRRAAAIGNNSSSTLTQSSQQQRNAPLSSIPEGDQSIVTFGPFSLESHAGRAIAHFVIPPLSQAGASSSSSEASTLENIPEVPYSVRSPVVSESNIPPVYSSDVIVVDSDSDEVIQIFVCFIVVVFFVFFILQIQYFFKFIC